MNYIKLVISIKNEYQELLITELDEMEFDGFEQLDDELITFISKERFHVGDRERIELLLAGMPGEGYIKSEEIVADQNWNESWEKTIKAQSIGLFMVKPTWSNDTPRADQIMLEIDPKMAFGTGYHETTRLMLEQLSDVIKPSDIILDAGTGTGILAIASIKIGAEHATAFDIDPWSVTNARENMLLNNVSEPIDLYEGSMETVRENIFFDAILANIQRHVITPMLQDFYHHLKKDGNLLISGILKKDENLMLEKLSEHHFKHIKTVQENEWIAIWATKEIL